MSSIGVGELVENVAILAGGFSREQISSEMTFIAREIHMNPRSIPVTVVLTTLLLGLVRGRAPRARSLRCVLLPLLLVGGREARGERVRAQQQQQPRQQQIWASFSVQSCCHRPQA